MQNSKSGSGYIISWKELGETPGEHMEKYRLNHGIPKTIKMCYAGRLDPMAQGVMVILKGEECKKMTNYLTTDKIYTAEAVLGVKTDSFDPMGLRLNFKTISHSDVDTYISNLKKISGTFIQKFPPYSAYAMRKNGRRAPLWQWAMNGELDESELPSKEVTVYSMEIIESESGWVTIQDYVKSVCCEISRVSLKNNMRQTKIQAEWVEFMNTYPHFKLYKAKFKTSVSSGTYIRSIVNNMCPDIPSHAHLITRIEHSVPDTAKPIEDLG